MTEGPSGSRRSAANVSAYAFVGLAVTPDTSETGDTWTSRSFGGVFEIGGGVFGISLFGRRTRFLGRPGPFFAFGTHAYDNMDE